MDLTRDLLIHIASLARLQLRDDDLDTLRRDLSQILDYVASLETLDTQDVPPTTHPIALTPALREDLLGQSLSRDDVLANAPQARDGAFVLPKIVDA